MSKLQEALDEWNLAAAECGWPTVRLLTKKRERCLYELLKNGLDDWREALQKAKESDFLCGRTLRSEKHSGWRFTFDFFVTESGFAKVLEGNYSNAERVQPQTCDPEKLQHAARLKGYRESGFWLPTWGPKPETQEVH